MKEEKINMDFIDRTVHIIENYTGPYGVTLLINCLLGLIILPKERDYNNISKKLEFCDLGIRHEIKSWGTVPAKERTAFHVLRCIRNSVAHFQMEMLWEDGEIRALRFHDQAGFVAEFAIDRLKEFVLCLAAFIRGGDRPGESKSR